MPLWGVVEAVPFDYDDHPARGRAFVPDARDDVHAGVADRIASEGLRPVVDVGSGTGRLRSALPPDWPWIGVDRSPTQLGEAPRPAVLGNAALLPIRSGSVGAVAALWMLYHLERPVLAAREAWRVLRPGGLFVACATRRDDSPELLAPRPPTTFDAEEAPAIVGEVFGEVEVESWDSRLLTLPDPGAVRRYLEGHFADPALADAVETPLRVTKRGSLLWARKRS